MTGNNMEAYVERMCKEHKDLVDKISKLANYINTKGIFDDSKIEFANKYLQFTSMRMYEEALRNRLLGVGIVCVDGQYFEKAAKVTDPVPDVELQGKTDTTVSE